MLHLSVAALSLAAPTALRPQLQHTRAGQAYLKEFDPFSSPRGPPLQDGQGGSAGDGPPQAPPTIPMDAEEEESKRILVLGGRVLGAGVGGFSGNRIWDGIEGAGLTTCTPFNLDGCPTARPEPVVRAAPKPTPSMDGDDFPFAEILRNPTSILPQDWQLPGRKYMDDLPSDQTTARYMGAQSAPVAAPVTPVAPVTPIAPVTPVAPVAPTPVPLPPSMPAALEPSEEQLARLRDIAKLKEELERLRGESGLPQPPAPIGVAPAGASEVPDALLALPADIHASGGAAMDHDALWQLYAAVADTSGGGGPGGLIATFLGAAIGALVVEYIATNREPPVPDPLFSGLYGTLHGGVKAASQATGLAADAVYSNVLGPQISKITGKVKDQLGDK